MLNIVRTKEGNSDAELEDLLARNFLQTFMKKKLQREKFQSDFFYLKMNLLNCIILKFVNVIFVTVKG